MDKDSSEIIKLTERIAKDPKSKLFVPLAEEYKKIGEIGKAVSILTEGLKNNPGYVTARSFLGRLLMESGDLVGAQKELEEVIKAIPDNLLAQRKLGDLYILLGRSDEALKRYKAALALNPGDKEVSAFIADLEAGNDISGRIARPKAAPTAAPSVKAGAPQPSAPAQKAPASPLAQARPLQQPPAGGPRAATSVTSPVQQTPTAPSAATTPVKEPPQKPTPQAAETPPAQQPVLGRPAESAPRPATVSPAAPPHITGPGAVTPSLVGGTPKTAETIVQQEPPLHLAEEGEVVHKDSRRPAKVPSPQEVTPEESIVDAFDLSEPAAEAISFGDEQQPLEWLPPEEPIMELTAEVKGDEPKDDINTDTLAELYISQAFYEKAIEIYERMLNERPGTAELEQKLQKLRSLAAAANTAGAAVSSPAAASAGVGPSGLEEGQPHVSGAREEPFPEKEVAEPLMQVPAADIHPAADVTERSISVEPEPLPAVGTRTAGPETDSLKAMQEILEGAERQKHTPESGAEQKIARTPQAATVRRKETIDRLELWLKNIMKEKPE